MSKPDYKILLSFSAVTVPLVLVSFLLTYNVILLPSLVIGDNFYWSRSTIADVLGLKVALESYLGSTTLLSTFRTGFLFPLAYILSLAHLPITLLYPFLFYVFSMLAFYVLSREFLQSRPLSLIMAMIYVINPVVPYYFASILSAFALVFLPLTMKFFIRALRSLYQSHGSHRLMKDLALSAVFLALSVSAHEQFFLSAALIAAFFLLTFLFVSIGKYGRSRLLAKVSLTSIFLFAIIFILVNLPVFMSLYNIGQSSSNTYYSGRFDDFLANVRYSYATTDFVTLLRFGGDSGVGLGHDSWFDSNAYTNAFGYVIFITFLISLGVLASHKDAKSLDHAFLRMNAVMFATTLLLIMFVKSLPDNKIIAERLFNFMLQTWESPAKLRVVLFLSGLTTTFAAFRWLETSRKLIRRKTLKVALVLVLVSSTIAYNSPLVINYAGFSPLQQIADNLKWGKLFDERYSRLADLLERSYFDERGIIIPYTHKAELYVPPNFRLFQLVSDINVETNKITALDFVPWSKIMGLLSVKYLVVNKDYEPSEALIFPVTIDNNITSIFEQIDNDNDLVLKEHSDNYTIFENSNALPQLYATNNFVFYDDVATLRYAIAAADFKDLPVFLGMGRQINQFSVPEFVHEGTYEVNAIDQSVSNAAPNLTLMINNGLHSNSLILDAKNTWNGVNLYSTRCKLSPNDTVEVPDAETWNETQRINELILNSTTFSLGELGSFALDFKVSLLQKGEFTFQAPRVVIDTGASKYSIIFHDNGVLELAISEGEVWHSGIMSRYVGYSLGGEGNSIEVGVHRIFDEVQVYVNGDMTMSFQTDPGITTVSLSSESSISRFTDISVKTRRILRLFASRQDSTPPTFSIQYSSPNKAVLSVSNEQSEYAVVSQYLYTQQRRIVTPVTSNEIKANVFFQGWIINAANSSNQEIITVDLSSSLVTAGVTLFSIFLTYAILFMQIPAVTKRVRPIASIIFKKVRYRILRGEKERNV